MTTRTLLGGILLLFAPIALAEDTGAPAKPHKAKAPDIALPPLAGIPKADGLSAPSPDKKDLEAKTKPTETSYSVVKVQHAHAFVQGAKGTVPVGPIDSLPLAGSPPTTAKFSTLVRVKSPQKLGAPIEVAILDPRGDIAMSANGTVMFRHRSDETNYLVDWDPTHLRAGGKYEVRIRVAGQPLGSWPLNVDEPK